VDIEALWITDDFIALLGIFYLDTGCIGIPEDNEIKFLSFAQS